MSTEAEEEQKEQKRCLFFFFFCPRTTLKSPLPLEPSCCEMSQQENSDFTDQAVTSSDTCPFPQRAMPLPSTTVIHQCISADASISKRAKKKKKILYSACTALFIFSFVHSRFTTLWEEPDCRSPQKKVAHHACAVP